MRSKAVLFLNVRSGRGRRWLVPIVESCAALDIDVVTTQLRLDPESIHQTLDLARSRGITTVLAAGGDGTIGCIAGHLVGTDFTLGVLPAGTSNDFARSLGIPMDPRAAVAMVAHDRPARVDVGVAGGKVFVHAAVLGLSTEFVRTEEALRRVLGRLSYVAAGIWSYVRRRKSHLVLTTKSGVHRYDAYEMAFVNAPVFAGPLGFEVAAADVNDRRLTVVVVESLSIWSLLRYLPTALTGHLGHLPGIETLSIVSAEISCETPLEVTVDGEKAGRTPMTIAVSPGGLRVFVPNSFGPPHERA